MSKAYKDAGVDIDAGNALVEAIKPLAGATDRPGTAGGLGGFGALFDLKAAGYADPILVAATDGVGTKLDIARAMARHDTIGVDLVAMCVNDLVVQGAEPLFFLDYFATGRLETDAAVAVVSGIAAGCAEAGCALIGGETAEMPGLYPPGAYDLAGFAVGAAERGTLIDGSTVAEGDLVLGLASSGVHSNGFSLVRKIVGERGPDLASEAPFEPERSLGDALLAPTRIYVRACLAALRTRGVKALAHITGGGLIENIPRVLPAGLGVRLDGGAWEVPPVFRWIADAGGVAAADMARTFNCGIGMAVVVAPNHAETVSAVLAGAGESVRTVGRVVPADGDARVVLDGWDGQWR